MNIWHSNVRSQLFDALVLISSCDKINPGMIMAAVRDGDEIVIDIPGRKLEVKLSESEIKGRLRDFKPLERAVPIVYLRRYRDLVSSSAQGAVIK